jgi:uncharacterized protein (TIRG00374 family)
VAICFATEFAFLSSPACAAGYVLNAALFRSSGINWSAAAAVVAVEQALDYLFLAVAVPIAAIASVATLRQLMPGGSFAVSPVTAAITLAAAWLLWRFRKRLIAGASRIACRNSWVKARIEQLPAFLSDLRAQVSVLRTSTITEVMLLFALTAVQWIARYAGLWLVLSDLGRELPFGFVFALQAVIVAVTQWTGVPAGGGGADLALAAALKHWLSTSATASALILWRYATLYVPLAAGVVCLAGLGACGRRASLKAG